MRPVLFYFRGMPIHSYPAMLYLGLIAGVFAGNFSAHASGLDPFRVYVAMLLLIIPALVGSRLLHVLAHFNMYRKNPARIFDRSTGGAAMYGGFLLALLFAVPLLYLLRLPFAAFWDVAIVSILAGMIFARIGCLLQGCCSGRSSHSRFTLYLPNHLGEWRKRIPTQFLESIWAAILLIAAISFRDRMPFPGALCAALCCVYAAGRLILETFREPEPGSTSRFTLHHAISLAMIVVAFATLSAKWPR